MESDKLSRAGVAGIDGGIRASLKTFEERRRFDALTRTGLSAVEALRRIENVRRQQVEGPSQPG